MARRRTDRFKLRQATPVEYYYLVVDRDFQRPIVSYSDGGYSFVSTPEKATSFPDRNEAQAFIDTHKAPSASNPLIILEKTR